MKEWEYVGPAWPVNDPRAKGWDTPAIAAAQAKTWGQLSPILKDSGPLGIGYEDVTVTRESLIGHNLVMSFAYVLGRCFSRSSRVSILDFGGGSGQYAAIANTLFPNALLHYNVHDLPHLSHLGRLFVPWAHFHVTDACFDQKYDLVVASGSIGYVEDWKSLVGKLSASASRYLYIGRTYVVRGPSFVVCQRPQSHGYDTEWIGWFLNRDDLVKTVEKTGLKLEREFLVGECPIVDGAPEQVDCRGFLFKR